MYHGRVKCPICGRSVTQSGTGTLTRHKAEPGKQLPYCPGGGKNAPRSRLKANQATAEMYPILQFFKYNHLPKELQSISAPWCTLAWKVARTLPHNAETSTALRKLLEGKDAAVRAALQH